MAPKKKEAAKKTATKTAKKYRLKRTGGGFHGARKR
jgi:hypothetical protein